MREFFLINSYSLYAPQRNNKESKTYVQGLRSFGNILPRGIKGILKKNGYNYSEIISKWNMLVGKDISKLFLS